MRYKPANVDENERVISIHAPHFCAGVVLKLGRVIDAAPIVRYMVGWEEKRVRQYCQKKSWAIPI